MSNIHMDVVIPVMAVCGFIFLSAAITWLWRVIHPTRNPDGKKKRRKAIKRAIMTMIASGAVLVAGTVALPAFGSVRTLTTKLTLKLPDYAGCGPVQVYASGPHPAGQTLVLATRQADTSAAQVESDVSWDPARKLWSGRVTFASSWPRHGQSSYTLSAYLVPQQLVSYVRVARDFRSGNTWWWQTQTPPYSSASTEIQVQLVHNPAPGQPGSRC